MRLGNMIGVVTSAIILGTTAGCSSGRASSAPDYREHYVRIEKEAGRTLDLLIEERDTGQRAMTPEFIERLYVWSKRLAVAQFRLADTREERVRVVGAYLAEMKRMDRSQKTRLHQERQLGMTEYYVAEAELWLERVKNE